MVDDRRSSRTLLAANLRRLRIARSLSLSQLAQATGLSKATVSGLENARANPTLETIEALAGQLRVSLGELLESPRPSAIRVVRAMRADGRPPTDTRTLDLLDGGELELVELVLAPETRRERAAAAGDGARAHLFVLDGRLVAGPAGRPTELTAGDYASFPLDAPLGLEAGVEGGRALLLAPPRPNL